MEACLIGDELYKKFYVACSFLLSLRVLKPIFVSIEVKVGDGIDI